MSVETNDLSVTEEECQAAMRELQDLKEEVRLISNRLVDISARIKCIKEKYGTE